MPNNSKKDRKERMIKTCIRKKAYPRMSKAQVAIKKMGQEKKLHAYACPVCAEWHIGHIVPKPIRMAP